jgi:hypothetical protein
MLLSKTLTTSCIQNATRQFSLIPLLASIWDPKCIFSYAWKYSFFSFHGTSSGYQKREIVIVSFKDVGRTAGAVCLTCFRYLILCFNFKCNLDFTISLHAISYFSCSSIRLWRNPQTLNLSPWMFICYMEVGAVWSEWNWAASQMVFFLKKKKKEERYFICMQFMQL